jgi:2-haloacid dehalogenase
MTNSVPITTLVFFFALAFLNGPSPAQEKTTPRFKAVAFDYFVIFDPNSVVPEVEKAFPGKGTEFTKMWRAKQFEYGFLRSITDHHADFFKVTEDALVYTAKAKCSWT